MDWRGTLHLVMIGSKEAIEGTGIFTAQPAQALLHPLRIVHHLQYPCPPVEGLGGIMGILSVLKNIIKLAQGLFKLLLLVQKPSPGPLTISGKTAVRIFLHDPVIIPNGFLNVSLPGIDHSHPVEYLRNPLSIFILILPDISLACLNKGVFFSLPEVCPPQP